MTTVLVRNRDQPNIALNALMPMETRAVQADDEPGVLHLLREAAGQSRYAESAMFAAKQAMRLQTREYNAIIVSTGGTITGIVVYGHVAGTEGTAELHAIAVASGARGQGQGRILLDAAVRDIASREARLLVVELPADPSLDPVRSFLLARGFQQEARVSDFFRDGVDLVLLRLDLVRDR